MIIPELSELDSNEPYFSMRMTFRLKTNGRLCTIMMMILLTVTNCHTYFSCRGLIIRYHHRHRAPSTTDWNPFQHTFNISASGCNQSFIRIHTFLTIIQCSICYIISSIIRISPSFIFFQTIYIYSDNCHVNMYAYVTVRASNFSIHWIVNSFG